MWQYHIDQTYENDSWENINAKKTAGKTLAKLEADDVGNTECTIHIRTCYYSNEISYCFLGICWFTLD